mmetsp:Transcript_26003/g.59825  ORF Transcript_26003/g.59825 Transcript_26003/m.59825 type:complete len:156 (-) Transcript_26003:286-753(-)
MWPLPHFRIVWAGPILLTPGQSTKFPFESTATVTTMAPQQQQQQEMPPQEAIRRYNEIMQESPKLVQKITELEMDRNEHKLVEETLQPLDPSRRAYRLVGEVLVERTVEEVLPSVASNRKNLEESIATLRGHLEKMQGEASELKTKYNLQTEASG